MAHPIKADDNKLTAKDKAAKQRSPKESAGDRLISKEQVHAQVAEFSAAIDELKIAYEQYFIGVHPLAPEQQHNEVKRKLRALVALPFKNSAVQFRVRNLESRYQTYNNYWQRVLRQREEGTYQRDLFKAKIRTKKKGEAVKKKDNGKAIETLYQRYKAALEDQLGLPVQIDFDAFRKKIAAQARDLKTKHNGRRLSFAVAVRGGKVTIQAQVRE